MAELDFNIKATVRTDKGKGASRRLRHADKVPAILYGGKGEPVALELDHNKVNNMADFEAFYSHILTLEFDGKKHQAILKDMQRHPYKPKLTHLDFQRVEKGHKLHTNLPLHFLNETTAKGVKEEGGVVVHHVNDVEITVLPKDLPEYLEVDIAELSVGDTIHLTDLKLPKGVELVELTKGDDHDQAVVSITAPRVEKEETEEDTVAPGDVPAENSKDDADEE
ncbi:MULTISPECIES: 50S ribosomal protein L25/general stress protein Ctc [Idiomarina]|jgi:large subunit ribosomal protein L25|uniref:Large ribosomal subunit protein bL25 n=1 Tax=Idiomarina abyssalis TaxID=86102 RepID=A0A8I1KGL8_9GAMM|nr:50S ribosomal protein L25/general stress protein Ctc [Idiomarina abyssalis]MBJ7267399.1 50S ribosomal protein L25/general stress protein Ctc [Idiomarina abyssalis]MBJ7273338.1 50S ribosomal protein L25/general stress protein Ctc [Idiomarina abyssalis]MBJ7315092.1 50S ribosomal protein L25/general stress protein Ctc [Idiomarina abyssalis]MDA6066359.1 50S ribosomal protein L25/general stress protein Ctc [Idiomarina abyssalis]QZN91780.1 50S ribosomal protein L25/general stress protein Ctc [Idi|tara:strand:- start:6162 stop:6830 length:669 start_codon:yes stop_codon:yes gene_type:complete